MNRTSPFIGVMLAAAAAASFSPCTALADGSTPKLREMSSVRSKGMGDATRAFASSDEALWVNPAGMSGTPRFNLAASAVFEVPKDDVLQFYSLSAIDSILNKDTAFPLGGGISYSYYKSGHGDEKRSGSIVHVGLSLPLIHENFTIGVTGKWMKLSGAVDMNAVTMDAGFIIRPIDLISIGAVGYNLVDVSSPEARRAWGFGLAVGTDSSFHVSGDVKLEQRPDDDKWRVTWGAGGEVIFRSMFMPRIGFQHDAVRNENKLGGGLSVFVSGLAIEAYYQYIFSGSHSFGLTLRIIDFG